MVGGGCSKLPSCPCPEGVEVLPNTTLEKVEYKNGKVYATTNSGQEVGHMTESGHMTCAPVTCVPPSCVLAEGGPCGPGCGAAA